MSKRTVPALGGPITFAQSLRTVRELFGVACGNHSQRRFARLLTERLERAVSQPTANAWLAGTTPVPERDRERLLDYLTDIDRR